MAWTFDPGRPPGERWFEPDPLTDPLEELPAEPARPGRHALQVEQDRIAVVAADLDADLAQVAAMAQRVRAGLHHIVAEALARLDAIPAP